MVKVLQAQQPVTAGTTGSQASADGAFEQVKPPVGRARWSVE